MPEDIHYKLLKLLQEKPTLRQRELARELGVSLGKTNYCLKALLAKGWIKANNFKSSNNKAAYAYLLTAEGIEAKAALTVGFLKSKMAEFEALKREIEMLKQEARNQMDRDHPQSLPLLTNKL
jgi:EPS-associated MarR family transcriptional regulator